ncbi:MAG: HEPN family nuclease [Sedimentisphaerales bacterium]|nr:HEPN family nuclease [Sedimentisphaerales bacterium]
MGIYGRDFVKVFAKRTRENLDAIEALRVLGAGVFEITQLVNSCLGLIAFPRQVCFDNIPETPLNKLDSEGWPIPHDEGEFPPAPNLNKLIEHLRNGIAHGRLKFSHDEKGEIESLLVWDERNRKKNWQARFNMDELRKFVVKFSDNLIDGSYCSECPGCSQCESDW